MSYMISCGDWSIELQLLDQGRWNIVEGILWAIERIFLG